MVLAGNILVRQRGTKFHPGVDVGIARDDTVFAVTNGIVKFERVGKLRQKVSILPEAKTKNYSPFILPSIKNAEVPTAVPEFKIHRMELPDGTGISFRIIVFYNQRLKNTIYKIH